jgi:hypothetical protein
MSGALDLGSACRQGLGGTRSDPRIRRLNENFKTKDQGSAGSTESYNDACCVDHSYVVAIESFCG